MKNTLASFKDFKSIKEYIQKLDINVVALGVILLILASIIFLSVPMALRTSVIKHNIVKREAEIEDAYDILEKMKNLKDKKKLIIYEDVSLVIDEITKIGKKYNINFITIMPQGVVDLDDLTIKKLPIHMELESEYKDLSLFIWALELLEDSFITIDSFEMNRHESIQPNIKAKVLVNLYLRAG